MRHEITNTLSITLTSESEYNYVNSLALELGVINNDRNIIKFNITSFVFEVNEYDNPAHFDALTHLVFLVSGGEIDDIRDFDYIRFINDSCDYKLY